MYTHYYQSATVTQLLEFIPYITCSNVIKVCCFVTLHQMKEDEVGGISDMGEMRLIKVSLGNFKGKEALETQHRWLILNWILNK